MSTTIVPITLIFEGVMIGRYDDTSKIYEMGVLPVPNHSFTITIEEVGAFGVKTTKIPFHKLEISPDNARWTLEVPNPAQPAILFKESAEPPDRTKEEPGLDLKIDYRWIPDLTGSEFPDHASDSSGQLSFHDGLLKPMLIFTTGEFYTRILSRGQMHYRQGGKGDWKKFGFVPEQVAADINLNSGEEIALKVEGTDEEVFRLKMQAGREYTVTFSNIPPDSSARAREDVEITDPDKIDLNRPTHFQLLYLLLNVPPEKRYEIRYLPTEALPAPEVLSIASVAPILKRRKLPIGIPTSVCSPVGTGGGG